MNTYELGILDFIQQNMRTAFLDKIMPVVTMFVDGGIIWILLTCVLLLFKKTRCTGFFMAVSLVINVVLCNVIIKPIVARIRPYDINTAVSLLVLKPTGYSFPSGHSTASFASSEALRQSGTRWWIPAYIFSALIAFSRLYLYLHFPTDVVVGAALGVLFGFAGSLLAARIWEKLPEKLRGLDLLPKKIFRRN